MTVMLRMHMLATLLCLFDTGVYKIKENTRNRVVSKFIKLSQRQLQGRRQEFFQGGGSKILLTCECYE